MGRELQKKKRKSGRPKVQRHKKSNKFNLQNPIIAANWDKTKTLSQNYRNLGLATKLNRQTGGKEPTRTEAAKAAATEQESLVIGGWGKPDPNAAIQEVRIERDPETGGILRVLEEPEVRVPKANPLNDPLNEVSGDEEGADENMQDWISLGRVPSSSHRGSKTDVVRALEQVAKGGVRVAPRTQSEREADWVESMIKKHGDDYEAMFRDRKLNVMQQSVGDLKRRVKKWKKANAVA